MHPPPPPLHARHVTDTSREAVDGEGPHRAISSKQLHPRAEPAYSGPLKATEVTPAYGNSLLVPRLRIDPGAVKMGIVVGRGAFGCVSLARLDESKRVVVKQVFSDPGKLTTSFKAKFDNPLQASCFRAIKELELLHLLGSKHVVHCYGGFFSLENGTLTCNMVMERYPGTLEKHLKKPQMQDLDCRIAMVGKLCRLLRFLTSQKVCHSDIKSNNILVSEDGVPVLCDFGVACSMGEMVGKDVIMDGDWTARSVANRRFNVHSAARTDLATPVVDMHGFMCMFVEMLYGAESNVFKTLKRQKVFMVWEARQSAIAARLPGFVGWADLVLNHGQEFCCNELMNECDRWALLKKGEETNSSVSSVCVVWCV